MSVLPVVILAGGLGTRIQEVAKGKPKALVEVFGQPFLFWKLQELMQQGVSEIFILGHIGADQIIEFLATFDSGKTRITFIDDGDTPLGTAGAIRAALAELPDRFILTYGDNLLPQHIDEFVEAFEELGKPNLLVVTSTVSSLETANTAVNDNLVTAYSKKPMPGIELGYLEYGYSIWAAETFRGLSIDYVPRDMSTLIRASADSEKLSAFITSAPYFEIGTPQGLERTEKWLAARASE